MSADKMRGKRDWKDLTKIIFDHDSFVFSTHVEPDADGLGAELALARYLQQNGKTVHILNPTDLRTNLSFMPHENEVHIYDTDAHLSIVESAEVFIAFDVGHYDRLGQLSKDLVACDAIKISIDHHPGDKEQFDHRFDYPEASSTGVMIYDLFTSIDSDILNKMDIALPIYAAIMSDTGNFRFNNTDPETLQAAAHLVSVGVKPYELFVHIYEDLNTPGRLVVLQHLLSKLKYDCDGRLAWSVIDFQEVSQKGATLDDLHSLSDFIRSIKGVEVGAAITKIPGKSPDVSFRSKGKIPINSVAGEFGGGGHAFAAGCSVNGSLDEAEKQIVEACRRRIKEWDANA